MVDFCCIPDIMSDLFICTSIYLYLYIFVYVGIYPETAAEKHEHWSSLAPLPFEVVLSAGQKAKEEPRKQGTTYLQY